MEVEEAGDLALEAGDIALEAGDLALEARDLALEAGDLALEAGGGRLDGVICWAGVGSRKLEVGRVRWSRWVEVESWRWMIGNGLVEVESWRWKTGCRQLVAVAKVRLGCCGCGAGAPGYCSIRLVRSSVVCCKIWCQIVSHSC